MIGVKTNSGYKILESITTKDYTDTVMGSIEQGLSESQYYSNGVASWMNLGNTTPDLVFISWQKGYWGVAAKGTFTRPFKHPDQAILSNAFTSSVIFVILDGPGILPVTPQTPAGTGGLGIYDISGNRAFGDGTEMNPAFNAIDAGGHNVIFYYAGKKEGSLYYSYGHRYRFLNVNRAVEVGMKMLFFDYVVAPGGIISPSGYAFKCPYARARFPARHLFYSCTQDDNTGSFVITDNQSQDVDIYAHDTGFPRIFFWNPPAVNYNLTFRECRIEELELNAFHALGDFTNLNMSLYGCSISVLSNITVEELTAFLSAYDFWYNGIRYTSIDSASLDLDPLDDRYFTRTVVTTAGLAYDIVDTDIGIWRQFTSNGAVSVTVNVDSLTTIGDVAALEYLGTGTLTLVAGAGVTLQVNENKSLISDGQYSAIFIKKTAVNTYRVFGELTPI